MLHRTRSSAGQVQIGPVDATEAVENIVRIVNGLIAAALAIPFHASRVRRAAGEAELRLS